MDYFKETDLDITYSHWKAESTDKYFLFPPIGLNQKLQGVQSNSNLEITRIDFELVENQSEILFKDLINGKIFKVDFSELKDGKISFSGQSGLKEYWIRQPLKKASIWM